MPPFASNNASINVWINASDNEPDNLASSYPQARPTIITAPCRQPTTPPPHFNRT
ncbi:hypothetical protein [Paraburkholderia megapolitana]|uniref:hypothetical protein n=1 Tax=Paraburkholderia megapolitana TaxID=420953 RepID=UPI001478C998|nr:hypothetical protein [Paraburkholderia megapolitana]